MSLRFRVDKGSARTRMDEAMVEQLAAAAQSLKGQVQQGHDSIRVFRLTDQDATLAEVDAVALRRQGQEAGGAVALLN